MRREKWNRWFKENQNGFTLVELIVTLAIFAIVLVVAGNYLFFGNNLFSKTAVKNSEKYIGDNALEYMQKRLTYAVKLEVINPSVKKPAPKHTKDVKLNDDGQLLMGEIGKEENILTSDFYSGGYQVSYEVTVLDANHLQLKVNVIAPAEETPVYSTEKILKILSLSDEKKSGETTSDENAETIEVTEGVYNQTYTNPIISYEDEKVVKTTYDPLTMKTRMIDTYKKVILKDEAGLRVKSKDGLSTYTYTDITGKGLYPNNDPISSYVVQVYYSGEPYEKSDSLALLYNRWPDLPEFDKLIIENTDKKVQAVTKQEGITQYVKFSEYLENNKGNLKIRPYIAYNKNSGNNKDMRCSCYIYVINRPDQAWSTRLIYCDEPGKSGWYYLAIKKNNNKGNVYVMNSVWSLDDDVLDPNYGDAKKPVYDEIMGKGEGIWVRVE